MIASPLLAALVSLGLLTPCRASTAEAEPATLTVTVVRDEGRAPIAGVVVVAAPKVRERADVLRSFTGPDGTVALELEPGVRYSVLFDGRAQGVCAQWREAGGLSAGREDGLRVRLPGLLTLEGKLVTENGEPLAAARVRTQRRVRSAGLESDEPHAEATTDADGAFVLRPGPWDHLAWVEEEGFAPCLVPIGALGRANGGALGTIVVKRAVALEGEVLAPGRVGLDLEYDLTLTVAYSELLSSVVDPDEVPGLGNDLVLEARTAPDGSFRFEGLPPRAEAYLVVALDGQPIARFQSRVEGDVWTVEAPPCVSVVGAALWSDGVPMWRPLRWVPVDVPGYSWGGPVQVPLNPDGEFDIAAIPAGTWEVKGFHVGYGHGPEEFERVVLDAEAGEQPVEVVFERTRSKGGGGFGDLEMYFFTVLAAAVLIFVLGVIAFAVWAQALSRRRQLEASGPWGDRIYDRR